MPKTATVLDQALLAEITEVGTAKAALLCIDLDDPTQRGCMWSLFREDEGIHNPVQACWALKAGTEDDWPGSSFTVVANRRARFLEWQRRLTELLGADPAMVTAQRYAETRGC